MPDCDGVLADLVQDAVPADPQPPQVGRALGERSVRAGIVGQLVNRVQHRADARRVIEERGGLENDEWVKDVISCLSPAQREVMWCFAGGLEIAEIAETLGKTSGTVRRHLCDACKRLRAELQPDGERKHQRRRGRKEAR